MHRAHAEQIAELTRERVQAWGLARAYRGPERRAQSKVNLWWRAHGPAVGYLLCAVSALVVVGGLWLAFR